MARRRRTRWAVTLTVLAAVAVVAWAAATDVQANARVRSEQTALHSSVGHLARTRTALAATSYEQALATNQRTAVKGSIASTLDQLSSTEAALQGTQAFAFLQGVDVGALQDCLHGVSGALQEIAANNDDQAAQDISGVSGPCLAVDGGSNDGLVYPFDFPDPDVILVGTTYYGYATNSVAGNIQIIRSTDRIHWSAVGNALPSLASWAAPHATWAPAVLQVGGTFDLYYAAVVAGGGEECVSVATATQPQGPFIDGSSAPLECQPTLGGSIDPYPFVNTDGTISLLWKSDGGSLPATIWSQPLDATGTVVAPNTAPAALLIPTQSWESGVVEAPDLVLSGGRYLLFYSGNNWNSANYGVGVAGCAGPAGPCTPLTDGPVLSGDSTMQGPGGESVFTDPSGSTWIAFHAWATGSVGYPHSRELYIRRLDLSGGAPSVGGAS